MLEYSRSYCVVMVTLNLRKVLGLVCPLGPIRVGSFYISSSIYANSHLHIVIRWVCCIVSLSSAPVQVQNAHG